MEEVDAHMKSLGRISVTSTPIRVATKIALSCLVILYLTNTANTLECHQKAPMKNFDITKYLSTYYEVYYYGNDNFTSFHRCPAESFYRENGTYNLYGSVLSFVNTDRFNWTGTFTMTTPGIFNVTQYIYDKTMHYDLHVLGTDYKNWIVVWSCPFLSNKEAAWIMTKNVILVNETLSSSDHKEISKVLARNNIPWSRFERTINYSCHE